jgi:hypothetical protein
LSACVHWLRTGLGATGRKASGTPPASASESLGGAGFEKGYVPTVEGGREAGRVVVKFFFCLFRAKFGRQGSFFGIAEKGTFALRAGEEGRP